MTRDDSRDLLDSNLTIFSVCAYFVKCRCELCLETGHTPSTLSLTKASVMHRTQKGQASIRKKGKGSTFAVQYMVCAKVQPEH